MRGGRGGGGMGAPRFRGGGRGFMGPGYGNGGGNGGGHGSGPGPSNHQGRGHQGPMGPGPDHGRQRPPMRFRGGWQDEMQGINEPEVFAETRLPDGRCYYYNTRTRETMWERPEGPGVRIIRHEEVGRGKGPPDGGPPIGNGQSFSRPVPMGYPGHMNDDHPRGGDFMGHNRDDGAPGTSPIQPFHHGSPQGPSPRSMLLPPSTMQGDHRFPMQGPNQSMMTPGPRLEGFHSGSPMGLQMTGNIAPPGFLNNQGTPPGANFGIPQPGQYPSPNFATIPPTWGFSPGMVPPAAVSSAGVENSVLAQMDPAILALASEWTEHVSPDGKPYYFSSKTQDSVWEKPKPLLDLELEKVQAQQRALANPQTNTNPGNTGSTPAQAELDSTNKSKIKRVEKKVEKCRPTSSTPVSGTPWCVVWTGDRRCFYYNPANKTSVWERPPELLGRADVEEMIRVCPAPKIKRAQATSTTSPLIDAHDTKVKGEVTRAPPAPAPAPTPTSHDDTRPPGEDASPEPPQKRIRTSSEDAKSTPGEDEDSGKPSPEVKELIETKDALREMTALEAEAKAARDRATIPMDIRLKQFRAMLVETHVSAFSTWEKELHKIVFDQRYLLLTSSERKRAFDRYVDEIVEEEKILKQSRYKENKEKFFQFLAEMKVTSKTNYSEFNQRHGREERCRAVEKSRDRESFFMEYLKMVQKKEKEKRALQKERDREAFLELLQEKVKDYHPTLSDVRKKLELDPRFQTLDPEERGELYRSFQHRLRQEQRANAKQRKRDRAAARDQEKAGNKDAKESGVKVANAADGAEDISEEEEGCITDDSEDELRYDRERQERAEHSIREREKQVQRSLATHLRDRDKEREFHRHEEAVQEFQALLTDVMRNADLTWRETRKLVKKDRRWDFVSVLPREEMEDLFIVHLDLVTRKKKQRFKELLDEHRVTPRTKWRDLYSKIKSDPRCSKFHVSERKCQREFEEYVREMQAHTKVEFRELLMETKMLNYRTFESLKHNSNLMREIESHLENDRRYLELDDIPEERERLLLDYLEDLESKGPPPPPTASEPTRRK